MERAFIYGDSLLKATMPDADMRYHFHLPEVMAQYPSDRLEVVNRAKMGATVTKGAARGPPHAVHKSILPQHRLLDLGGKAFKAAQVLRLHVGGAPGQQAFVLHVPQHLTAVFQRRLGVGILFF